MAKSYWLARAQQELDRMPPDEVELNWAPELWEEPPVEVLATLLEHCEMPLILAAD